MLPCAHRQILLTEGKVQRRSASTHTLGQGFQFSATGCYKTTVQAKASAAETSPLLESHVSFSFATPPIPNTARTGVSEASLKRGWKVRNLCIKFAQKEGHEKATEQKQTLLLQTTFTECFTGSTEGAAILLLRTLFSCSTMSLFYLKTCTPLKGTL